MEISPVTRDSLDELGALYAELIPHAPDVNRMESVFDDLQANPDHYLYGAWSDGRLVGSAIGVVCSLLFGHCKPFMVIEDVVVTQQSRRRGAGRQLMIALEKIAKQRDCAYILLTTDQDRIPAQRLYESLGYETRPYLGYRKTLSSNT